MPKVVKLNSGVYSLYHYLFYLREAVHRPQINEYINEVNRERREDTLFLQKLSILRIYDQNSS